MPMVIARINFAVESSHNPCSDRKENYRIKLLQAIIISLKNKKGNIKQFKLTN
jgi:hypothetical protein